MRGLRLAAAVLIAGALTACGGDDDRGSAGTWQHPPASTAAVPAPSGGEPPPGPGAPRTTAPQPAPAPTATRGGDATSAPSPQSTTTSTKKRGGSRFVQWIKNMGITGGGDPEGDVVAYEVLARGDCAAVFGLREDSFDDGMRTLYHGAAWACLAAFEGRTDNWARAEDAYETMSASGRELDCLGVPTMELLGALVRAHRADPGVRFVRGGQGQAQRPLCPRILRLEPDHGPLEGGYEVLLIGENLPAEATVSWNFEDFTVSTDGTEGTIVVPPAAEEGGVPVYETGWPWAVFGTPWFVYDGPPR